MHICLTLYRDGAAAARAERCPLRNSVREPAAASHLQVHSVLTAPARRCLSTAQLIAQLQVEAARAGVCGGRMSKDGGGFEG
jgi:hypothetical protein